jgi:multiple sugar transport system substrate-binding protein
MPTISTSTKRPRRLVTAVGAAAVAASVMLAGCAKGSATKSSDSNGTVTIHYLTFSAAPDHLKDLGAIVSSFEKANPKIKVAVQSAPYSSYFTQLQTSIAGGTAPDTFELDYADFVTYAANGSLLDMAAPAAADANWQPNVLSPSSMSEFQYSGKQYALPESFSTVLLIYNKNLFDQAHLAYPTSSWTWNDMMNAATKLTAKSKGTYGLFQPVTFNEFYKALDQAGGQFFNADKTQATFNSPQGVAAANWLIGKLGKTMPTLAQVGSTPNFDTNLFTSGKLAMWINGNWQFDGLKSVPFGYDVAVEPGDTTQASAVFENGVAISKSSPHASQAFKWLDYLTTSEESTQARISSSWELPPLADSSKLSGYLDIKPPANRQAVFDSLQHQSLQPVIAKEQQLQDIVNNALESAAEGKQSVQQALDSAAAKVNTLLH